jgi:hypothetical protein
MGLQQACQRRFADADHSFDGDKFMWSHSCRL